MKGAEVGNAKDASAVALAAEWLAADGADKAKAAVPQVRKQFGLSALDACEAIRRANLLRVGAP